MSRRIRGFNRHKRNIYMDYVSTVVKKTSVAATDEGNIIVLHKKLVKIICTTRNPFCFIVLGESNTNDPDHYKCRFVAMINDWRLNFNLGSQNETDAMFPFGFVQVFFRFKQP